MEILTSDLEIERNFFFARFLVSKSAWLRSPPAASAKYTRYPLGLGNLRAPPFPVFGRNAGRIGRASHRACRRRIAWLRSRPAASTTYSRRPIGSRKHPHFCFCDRRALLRGRIAFVKNGNVVFGKLEQQIKIDQLFWRFSAIWA